MHTLDAFDTSGSSPPRRTITPPDHILNRNLDPAPDLDCLRCGTGLCINCRSRHRRDRVALTPLAHRATAEQREALLTRRCAYCRAARAAHLDHIVPLSRGGADSAANLAPSCEPCNLRKTNKTAAEFGRPDLQGQTLADLGVTA